MKVSEHAKQRFVERMKSIDPKDAATWTAMNNDMIIEQFTKLIEHATCIYSGASFINNKGKVDILLKDTRIIIYDSHKETVVTVYSIDLGLGKEFNKEYVDRLIEKIKALEEQRSKEVEGKQELIDQYTDQISEHERHIADLRRQIKNDEEMIEHYKGLKYGLLNEISDSRQELRDLVETLIKKKIF